MASDMTCCRFFATLMNVLYRKSVSLMALVLHLSSGQVNQ